MQLLVTETDKTTQGYQEDPGFMMRETYAPLVLSDVTVSFSGTVKCVCGHEEQIGFSMLSKTVWHCSNCDEENMIELAAQPWNLTYRGDFGTQQGAVVAAPEGEHNEAAQS